MSITISTSTTKDYKMLIYLIKSFCLAFKISLIKKYAKYTHNHTDRVRLFHRKVSSRNVSRNITSLVKTTENSEGGENNPYRCRRRDRKSSRSFIPPWRMRGHTSRKNVERGESSGNGHQEGSMRAVGVLEVPVWKEYLRMFIYSFSLMVF